MNVLSGVIHPSEGEVRIDGQMVHLTSPHAAHQAGIATVYQEFSLVPQLSVARNIFLGREPRGRLGSVDAERLHADTRALLDRYGIRLDARAEVATLSVAEQQMIEIARALSRSARILILDEPTAVLSLKEQENLFSIMRGLRDRGILILYVSHRLQEVVAIADRATVLRDGARVATKEMREVGVADLVELMIGRRTTATERRPPSPNGRVFAIEYRSDSGTSRVSLEGGEILGVGGLVGAGRTTFGRALAGRAGPSAKVTLTIDGQPVDLGSPQTAMQAGIVYLTEDRKRDGIFPALDIVSNAVASALPRLAAGGIRRHRREREATSAMAERLRLVAAGLNTGLTKLSGGNQQKVVLGRALMTNPKLLICDEPTRGIDVGAKAEIHDILAELAGAGTAIIVISSEIDEVLALSHRVVAMAGHRIVAEYLAAEIDEAGILLAASSAPQGDHQT
jgi:ABC-type sugar transport system ATPase subunit